MTEILTPQEKQRIVQGAQAIIDGVRPLQPRERVDVLLELLETSRQEADIPLSEILDRIAVRCAPAEK